MFRKILDKVKGTNFDKLKRDTRIQIKRASFYTQKFGNELKAKVPNPKFNEKIPGLIKYLKDTKRNLDLDKLDNLKNKKIDEWNSKFEEKLKGSFYVLKNLFKKSKEIPKATTKYSKTFVQETKSYAKESYIEGVAHMKNYFKSNQKYFEHRRKEYLDAYRKKRNNILMIGGGALFIYSVGSNIPHAIVSYKLAQNHLENSREGKVEDGQSLKELSETSEGVIKGVELEIKSSVISNPAGTEVKGPSN